jgi:curli production assembly/transport component CsgG
MVTTMIYKLLPLVMAMSLTGCGTIGNYARTMPEPVITRPAVKNEPVLLAPASGPITVAVYNFRDMTGQRKASTMIAQLSSAVTQGADAYLVKSLQEVGGGRWFKVLERGGLDNIVKERQLIRQMRELYQGKDAQALPPMMFAGMIIEGGIIGYDSNTMTGGSGARLLGIGASTQYSQDEVTISLRAVSVASGEVLVAINTTKTVISFQDKVGVLRFNDIGTQSLELETGSATNESMNRAVQVTIHAAVIEMIKEGERKGHWQYKKDTPVVMVPVVPAQPEIKAVPAPAPLADTQPEPIKAKETNNELVQPQTPQAPAVDEKPPVSVPQQSDVGPSNGPIKETEPTVEKTEKENTSSVSNKVFYKAKFQTRVRKEPGYSAPVVNVIKEGSIIEAVQIQAGWLLVKVDDGQALGWVGSRVVEKQ